MEESLANLAKLEENIEYYFNNKSLLFESMVHPSMTYRNPNITYIINYQRLEFLGDGVLGLVTAQMLMNLFPLENEGSLAKRQSALVQGDTLALIAKEIKLNEFMIMSEGEISLGGRDNPGNLEDALEALIGAIYLDGGLEKARDFILKYWYEKALSTLEVPKDSKSELQEWVQAKGWAAPKYKIISTKGPAHSPIFRVEVSLQDNMKTMAGGNNKKVAEKKAAKKLLEILKAQENENRTQITDILND